MHTCSDRELALLRTFRGALGRVEWMFDDGAVRGLQKVSMVKMKVCLGEVGLRVYMRKLWLLSVCAIVTSL